MSSLRRPLRLTVPLLLLLASRAPAQPDTVKIRELEQAVRDFKDPSVGDLLLGQFSADPNNPTHKKMMEAEARLVATRIYSADYQKPYNVSPNPDRPNETNDQSIHKVFVAYESDLSSLTRYKEQTKAAAQLFARAVLDQGKQVLDYEKEHQRRPLVLMNIVRMMARTADLGQPETADYLVDVLREPPAGNQGAQYWAAKGLRDLLATNPNVLSPPQAEKTALALSAFIDKKVKFEAGVPLAEIDGYRALRREAIRALALTHVPGYGDKGQPAWVLLKVMSNSDMLPEPRMDERAEAAIGLARMRPEEDDKDYHADYAAQQIVAFVADFGAFYQEKAKTAGLPVRTLAARLGDELKALKGAVPDPYVAEAVEAVRLPLAGIEKGEAVTPELVRDWLTAHKAPNQTLFKSDPKTTVGGAVKGP